MLKTKWLASRQTQVEVLKSLSVANLYVCRGVGHRVFCLTFFPFSTGLYLHSRYLKLQKWYRKAKFIYENQSMDRALEALEVTVLLS